MSGALGKGLDALIREPESKPKKKEVKKEEKVKKNETNSQSSLMDDKLEQIMEEVEKNPRISLWSPQSAATLRYLKKTTPEFSISKEASIILEEAISSKYPEVWKLFDDL